MRDLDSDRNRTGRFVVSRVSWGAIFAGVVIIMVTQLCLSLLGVSIGAGTFEPQAEANPLSGLGMGSAIWLVISAIFALFAGGWVAGRLSASATKTEGALHGVLSWGLASLAAFYLVTTTVGTLISGAFGLAGRTVALAGQGVKAVAPEIAEAVGLNKMDVATLKQEARSLLKQTGKPELQPKTLEKGADEVADAAREGLGDVAQSPQHADAEVDALLDRFFARGKTTLDAVDKDALVNVLVARTEMTEDEAQRTVDNWERTVSQAQTKISDVASQASTKAKEAAGKAAGGVSTAAAWAFMGLILGFISAALGGFLGSPTPVKSVRVGIRSDIAA